MQDIPEESHVVQEPSQPKKEYHAPEVRDYGTIQELTLANLSGPHYPDTGTGYTTT